MAEFPNDNDTAAEDDQTLGNPTSLRYNLDSLDDYLATGEKVAREGRLTEAVDLMREATNRFPDSATGKYNLGVALFLRLREDNAHLYTEPQSIAIPRCRLSPEVTVPPRMGPIYLRPEFQRNQRMRLISKRTHSRHVQRKSKAPDIAGPNSNV